MRSIICTIHSPLTLKYCACVGIYICCTQNTTDVHLYVFHLYLSVDDSANFEKTVVGDNHLLLSEDDKKNRVECIYTEWVIVPLAEGEKQ